MSALAARLRTHIQLDKIHRTSQAPEQDWRRICFRLRRKHFDDYRILHNRAFRHRARRGCALGFGYKLGLELLCLRVYQHNYTAFQ